MRAFLPPIGYRAWRVWQRNRDTYLRLWRSELLPPLVEPLLYLLALGAGLGVYVTGLGGESYMRFLAPGILAQAAMWSAAFECTYGSYIRMEIQKTFEAIVATPVSIEEVIAGEILWGSTRGLLSAAAVLTVIVVLGLAASPLALLALPVAALTSFTFASVSMLFTAIAPAINFFNYYITLGLTPIFLVSGVFFPLDAMPRIIREAAWFSPLTHAINPTRALVRGEWDPALWGDLLWLALVGLAFFYISLALMRRRLIK